MPGPRPADAPTGVTLDHPMVHRVMRRAVLLPVVMVTLLCGPLGWQRRGLVRGHGWVTHTERVLAQINLTQRLVVDHERALPGRRFAARAGGAGARTPAPSRSSPVQALAGGTSLKRNPCGDP